MTSKSTGRKIFNVCVCLVIFYSNCWVEFAARRDLRGAVGCANGNWDECRAAGEKVR